MNAANAPSERALALAQLLDGLLDDIADRVADRLKATTAQPGPDHLLSVEEVAGRLGIGVSTVYKRAASGELASVKDGARVLFSSKHIDAYLAARIRNERPVVDRERVAFLAQEALRRGG